MNNTTENQITPKHYMRVASLIYFIILSGLLLLTLFSYYMGNKPIVGFSSDGDIWIYIVPLSAMNGYFGGNLIVARRLSNIAKESSLGQKLYTYMGAGIIRLALLEAAAFIGIFAYWKNNKIFYLIIVASLILYLFKLRPTKERAIREMGLEGKDRDHFRNDREGSQ